MQAGLFGRIGPHVGHPKETWDDDTETRFMRQKLLIYLLQMRQHVVKRRKATAGWSFCSF